MRIGFFGTPEISARCLEYLREKHEILFLVTQEDKKVGRHQRIVFSPAKEAAIRLGIPVIQPETLKDPDFSAEIGKYDAEIYVVVAYGRIIPRNIFERPALKTVNLHPSMLPRYRGAAPIEWALINGEAETGVTVQLINERLDAGDIVLQERIPITPDMNAEDLYRESISLGAPLLDRAIRLLSGGASTAKQYDGAATFCKKIDRDTARISWQAPATAVHNLVRGLNPKPVAWTMFRDKGVRIWKTSLLSDVSGIRLNAGDVLRYQKKRLLAGTGDGIIELLKIQPENRDAMDALPFINGYRIVEGDRFI